MSNLPPGVSESMIPGNRPEDIAAEDFWNKLEERFGALPDYQPRKEAIDKIMEDDDLCEAFSAYVMLARDLAHEEAARDAKIEADLAAAYKQERET